MSILKSVVQSTEMDCLPGAVVVIQGMIISKKKNTGFLICLTENQEWIILRLGKHVCIGQGKCLVMIFNCFYRSYGG